MIHQVLPNSAVAAGDINYHFEALAAAMTAASSNLLISATSSLVYADRTPVPFATSGSLEYCTSLTYCQTR